MLLSHLSWPHLQTRYADREAWTGTLLSFDSASWDILNHDAPKHLVFLYLFYLRLFSCPAELQLVLNAGLSKPIVSSCGYVLSVVFHKRKKKEVIFVASLVPTKMKLKKKLWSTNCELINFANITSRWKDINISNRLSSLQTDSQSIDRIMHFHLESFWVEFIQLSLVSPCFLGGFQQPSLASFLPSLLFCTYSSCRSKILHALSFLACKWSSSYASLMRRYRHTGKDRVGLSEVFKTDLTLFQLNSKIQFLLTWLGIVSLSSPKKELGHSSALLSREA